MAGARDKQGVLQSIEVLPTRQLPHMAANANVGFDTWQQIHFGNDVLTWMQQLTGVHKEQHLRFNYQEDQSGHSIRCSVLDEGLLPSRLKTFLQQSAQQ